MDVMGNLTNVVYSGGPATPQIKLGYDLLNRLTNMVDGIGSTAFAWTDGGQLASEDGPWSSDAVSYEYSHRLRGGLSLQQASDSAWAQGYGYDAYRRLTDVTSPAGVFGTQYKATYDGGYYTASELVERMDLPGGSWVEKGYDAIGRLINTALYNSDWELLNWHGYDYNDGHQRTRQVFAAGNYVDYTYDDIGQLKTAKGWEPGGSTARSHEQFGYAYDAAWNLSYRTNNALTQSFGVNSLNQLSSLSRSGSYTVAGAVSTTPTSVTVKDNANAPQAATVYDDNSFQRSGITLLNGNNTFQAVAQDSLNRWDTNTVTAYLPESATCYYDLRGNLTNDGRRVFYYDSENQLTNVTVTGAWKSEFGYDGFMRRRVRKEFTWSSGTWVQTNEVRYVYDGRLVIQERHYTPGGGTLIPLNTITYTRGNDLSGTFEGAGGIAGLLARSEILSSIAPGDGGSTATYHSDGNGNVTALVATNGLILARYSYDPYGNLLGMSGPMAEANLYRFSSKEWHEKSGLVYYLYRYYEPSLQRWVNRDPIQEQGGWNLYSIARNAPLSFLDPVGLEVYPPNFMGPLQPDDSRAASWLLYYWSQLDEATGGPQYRELLDKYREWTGSNLSKCPIIVQNAVGMMEQTGGVGLGPASVGAVRPFGWKAPPKPPQLKPGGKLGGKLPTHIPENWKRDELEQLADDLRESIRNRQLEQRRLGEDGPHRRRLGEEEQLLRQVDKKLCGS